MSMMLRMYQVLSFKSRRHLFKGSIQRFEIGIHKDLPIKETIFFGGGGVGELRSTFERFFFSFFS